MAALHKTSSDHNQHLDLRIDVLVMGLRGCLSRNRLAGSGSVPDLPLTPTGLEDRDFAAITRSSHCWILFDYATKMKVSTSLYCLLYVTSAQKFLCSDHLGYKSDAFLHIIHFNI